MTRKYATLLFASVPAVALLASCGGNSAASGDASGGSNSVTVVDGGGAYHDAMVKAIYKPFEKKTGIKVVSQSYDYSLGSIKAQVEGAHQWDVVSTSTPLTDADAAQLFQPIDYKTVHANELSNMDASKYFLWSVYSANNLAWNTKSIKNPPTSWADLWNTKRFPGPRALWNSPQSTLEIALLADGVSWKHMYPLDVNRAFKKLDELRQKTKVVWYDSGAQQVQMFSSGTAVIGEGWNGRMIDAKKAGQPVNYTLKGAISGGTAWAVLKTAPNAQNAMKFLDYAASAQAGAALAKDFPGMSPANNTSYKMLPQSIARSLESNPANAAKVAGKMDYLWWAKNYDSVFARWQKWYTGQ